MLVTVCVQRYRVHAPAWMFLAGTHLVARIAMIYMKDLTGRLRPTEWLKHGGDGTFWRGGLSFPSGHAVLFAGIVVPLLVLFPRARAALVLVAFVLTAIGMYYLVRHLTGDRRGAAVGSFGEACDC